MNKIRLYENLHVLLWLLKDTCWLLHLVIPGTIMILPTLFMALYITWKTRKNKMHWIPNAAVTCWLSANITWMLGEFYHFPHTLPAAIFFSFGLLIIGWYFVLLGRAKRRDKIKG